MPFFHDSVRAGLVSLTRLLAAVPVLMGLNATGAWASYLVAPGDVIELSVVGLPELRQRATVNMEGQVSLPLIGLVNVAGLTLNDLQSKLRNDLTNKTVRNRAQDGSERAVYIYPEEITVTIAENRPIYVNGDVSRPGELPYRAKMTIRQAIALAGGLDVMRARAGVDPAMQEVDLQAEGRLLHAEYLRQQAVVARLSGELSGAPSKSADGAGSGGQPLTKVQRAQMEQLDIALEDYKKEVASLQKSVEQTQSQIGTLERLREELMQSYQQQAADVARLRQNLEKGLTSIGRLSEEQRALSFVSERLLQTEANLTIARRGEEEQKRQLQRVDDQRRLRLVREREEAENRLADIRTRIQAAGDKLMHVGALKSRGQENTTDNPSFKIFRKDGNTWSGSDAVYDTELMPGDVVEVMLPREIFKATE
ncbi:polysaccharide biosynthesis/export family protein [Microvirga lotononidis]|uniref:Periplasmic protein involved in polysaccharide export n=1 Tax=Microvirga lotononidis TaxID=864069 RepID=I4YY96_9HYPH|nr:polysaccharide biosynthesis/export family protein [Microvirga lotononidis]EIM28938.1 periplasmic protein involved in polysaccharide export [Microvirga lotononidis]WQO26856.1 polysaccharide biosynthesis/export family protein [Microvirga lotononidis]